MARLKFYNTQTNQWEYVDSKTSGVSKDVVQQIVSDYFKQFFIVGPDEPASGPCLWFDTKGTLKRTVVYLDLDALTEDTDVSVEIDDFEYEVLNADSPVLADDGEFVIINVGEENIV